MKENRDADIHNPVYGNYDVGGNDDDDDEDDGDAYNNNNDDVMRVMVMERILIMLKTI